MLEDADDKILNCPLLFEFVRDLPWVDVYSSNVNEILRDNGSFKEKLDPIKDRAIISSLVR